MDTGFDSDSDSDLEIIPRDAAAPLPTFQRRVPATQTYGKRAFPSVLGPTQQSAGTDDVGKAEAELRGDVKGDDDDENDEEEEEEIDVPRSSGTVREPAEGAGQQQEEDREDDIDRLKSGGAAIPTSTGDISFSPAQHKPYQLPSSRQPVIKLDLADEVEETQPPSDAPGSGPASDSPGDIFGAFFNDTQPFDAQEHGKDADIDIFAHPAATQAPRRLEDDGDETRVEGDYGFDRLRQDQEIARNGAGDTFDALPSLPEPTLEEDMDSGEEDIMRAMEKQQLILQVERQRANAQADGQPRLMHLNRDGLFTQTEPSQFLDDTQSQMFSQDSDHEDVAAPAPQRHSSPMRPINNNDDVFSEDSDGEEQDAPPVAAPKPASSPRSSQARKRTIAEVTASSSPLTSLPPSSLIDDELETVSKKRKRQATTRIADSDDEEEGQAQSSPSPRKTARRVIIIDDDEEEDNVGPDADALKVEHDRDDERNHAEHSDHDGEADAGMSGQEDHSDDEEFKLPKVAYLIEKPFDPDDQDFTDDEDEEAQRDPFKPGSKGKGKQKAKDNGKKGKAAKNSLSSFLGIASPPRATQNDIASNADPAGKKKNNAFIAGEAEESEDDERLPGKRSNKGGLAGVFSDDEDDGDEDDEDGEDDGKDLAELVDDEQDEEQAEKDALVAEKYHLDREEQDKADEDLHTRATKGMLRKARPGMGLDNELDDDAQDDIDRRRIAQGPQKRKVSGEKDGLDDIQNTALAMVYKADIRNDVADEADFLAPPESESEDEDVDVEGYSEPEDSKTAAVRASDVRAEMRALAKAKREQSRRAQTVVISDDEGEGGDTAGDRHGRGQNGRQAGADSDDDGFDMHRIHFNNRITPAAYTSNSESKDAGSNAQAGPGGRMFFGGGGRILAFGEDDDDKNAMDLVIRRRVRNEAEEAKLRRAANELGDGNANGRRLHGSYGGGGASKQNTSSITQFGQVRQRQGAGASSGLGATTTVMRTGLGHPSSRRPAGGGAGAGGAGAGSRVGALSKLGVLNGNRSLKFGDSQ
ncbi:hypothetical protein OC835_001046 [Tilletia horrida]|nr:hypothetical protein OC835_001046 [Tilletia horrida]